MTSLLSNVSMNMVGKTPTATSSSTATMKPPVSKARLLFNSDGSVKLMGDPSSFPGSGIDGNSHTLIPTIAPDGKMTMLLTPADGEGKTFILSPTNGACLPNPETILNSSSKSTIPLTSDSSSQSVTTVSSSERVRYSANPRKNINSTNNVRKGPVMPTTDGNTKTLFPTQKSLLTGLCSKVCSRPTQFTTHMRIDASGSHISTVNVPVTDSQISAKRSLIAGEDDTCTSKNMFGSTVLKHIADQVSPLDSGKKCSSPLSGLYAQPDRIINMHPSQISQTNSKETCQGQKYASANKTKIVADKTDHSYYRCSKVGLAPGSDVSKNFLMIPSSAPTAASPGTYTIVLGAPPVQTSSKIQLPSTVTSATPVMTAKVGSQTVSMPLSTIPIANTSNVMNTSSFITASSLSLLDAPGPPNVALTSPQTTQPLQFVIKNGQLTSVGDNKTVAPATTTLQKLIVQFPLMTKQSKTTTGVSQSKGFETWNIASNAVGGPFIPADQVESYADLKVDARKESEENTFDQVTGCLNVESTSEKESAHPELEDDFMSIKIDSVFSLSTKDEIENSDTKVVVKEEAMDPDVHIKEESASDGKPKTVTCHPSYVVLEQMSQKQIENPNECIFKCTEYCRVRTLNFLCSLGLVNCKPTQHTINPIKKEKDPIEICSEKTGHKNRSKKRKGRRHKEDSGGSVQLDCVKKEPDDNSTPVSLAPDTKGSASEKIKQNRCPDTVSSAKVRKVESPGSPITKVIKFTKVEKEQVHEKTSKVITSPEKPVPSGTNIGVIPSIYPKTSTSLSTKSLPSSPVTAQASKVMPRNPPVQLAANLKSMLPMTKLMASNNKQYFLFNLNGKKILVPASNDLQKPKAFVLKGDSPSLNPNTAYTLTMPPTSSTVSSVTKPKPSPGIARQTVSTSLLGDLSKNNIKQKRSLQSILSPRNQSKFVKLTPKEDTLPSGIRIKSEPVTHGYGDEEPPQLTKQKKVSGVKIKKEPVDSEWHEIWSSTSRPLADSSPVPEVDKSGSSTDSANTSLDESQTTFDASNVYDDAPMPDLPMMKVPSTKEIAQKTAAHNNRIERLRAMLKEKEKIIEELKMKRIEEGSAIEEEETCNTNETLYEKSPCPTDVTSCVTSQMTEDTPTDNSERDLKRRAPETEKIIQGEDATVLGEETTAPLAETISPGDCEGIGDVVT